MKRMVGVIALLGTLLAPMAAMHVQTAEAASAVRQNDDPIVLVHGFTGWGRDEVLGYKYWGGFDDLQNFLTDHGYTSYTAAVGPVSSNWDRAVELYAQIKGGTVDYGAAHAAKHGHARYGRTYPGLYKDWGTLNATTGKVNKIHLLGHSMGGQTVRTLVQLLENGSAEETGYTTDGTLSPLFGGQNKSWVNSVTSVSTPHDGTSLTEGVDGVVPLAQQIIGVASAAVGTTEHPFYDFKLDQFGMKKQPGESFASYSDRVWNSSLWNTKDIAKWDLSADGAKELNTWVKAQPDVYYFSWGTEETFRELFTGYEDPELTMNTALTSFSYFLGSYTRNTAGHVPITSSWWKNDGVVNTNSMDGPSVGSTDKIVSYAGTPQRGVWNYMGVKDSTDHLEVVGHGNLWSMDDWYLKQAQLLGTLPE